MSITGKYKDFGKKEAVQTRTYRGPDRRGVSNTSENVRITKKVRFDDKGNPVMDVDIESATPRRRQDDRTLNTLKCLAGDIPDLKISED